MNLRLIIFLVLIITSGSLRAGTAAPFGGVLAFTFSSDAHSINGDTLLADDLKAALDGETEPDAFDLSALIAGLTLTVTPSQTDISYTATGLGLDTGGTFSAEGDSLTFQFNRAITFDFLDVGQFTTAGNDSVTLSFANENPERLLPAGSFDDNARDTIAFSADNALAANESFTLSRVSGTFTLEGFTVTVIPESSYLPLLASGLALSLIVLRRHRER